jgi:nucleoside-diphosphate kinase
MERTLAILKPDTVRKRQMGQILARIEEAGFGVVALRLTQLTREQAEGFYAVHRKRPFFHDLVEFMTSGPCVPMVLEKENAVADFRALIGATDPAEAAAGTIRRDFAENKTFNAVHGSDSAANGRLEAAFFFDESEIIYNRAKMEP